MRILVLALLLGCCLPSFAQSQDSVADRIVGSALTRGEAIMDSGAQAPLGFQVNHRADLLAPVQSIIAPLAALDAGKVYPEGDPDTDHVPFQAEGVPAIVLAVEDGEYAIHHHASTDTLDKIDPKMLTLDTAVMALAAYTFANTKETPARRLSAEEVHQYLKDTGLADGFAILYGPGKP